MRRGSIEDHLSVTPFAGDGVGLEAIAVGEVAANDTFVREKVHLVHQVGIDGETALVLDVCIGDQRAMNF